MFVDKAMIFDMPAENRKLALRLNEVACCGYELQGITPLFGSINAAIYSLPRGNYIDKAVFRFGKNEQGSLFRCWDLKLHGKRENINEEMQTYIDFENTQGYRLADILPLTAFSPDKPGPGSIGVSLVFERRGGEDTDISLDKWSLKDNREESVSVPCPVLGCKYSVDRMTKNGPNLDSDKTLLYNYLCPDHRIYISPSTFEYENPLQSILWRTPADKDALSVFRIPNGKRTWSRMGRENDEDSLTWNVFYFLEKYNLLGQFLSVHVKSQYGYFDTNVKKTVYWSVDMQQNQVWQDLIQARNVLGESDFHGSEPDLFLVTENHVILLEVKFKSEAYTKRDDIPQYYEDAEKELQVFSVSLKEAVEQLGYEMVRFFLLGTALESITKKQFCYITLTRSEQDNDLLCKVKKVVKNPQTLIHINWGQVEKFLSGISLQGKAKAEKRILTRYLNGKTAGYSNQHMQHLLD